MALLPPPQSYDITAPTATPSLLSIPTPSLALPASANVWNTGLDFPHRAPTLPTSCAALIAFLLALAFIAAFLAVGWRRGSKAIIADEEKAEVSVQDVERSSIAITVISDTEVFSAEKKL
ncbi:hypothetical protein RhiJN_06641 [Ceratobasidium sp. AG-Ba]|nr:hypothetical protein RhiJN_06641 [Ceratobasidium sp. AG-Ba]